MLVPHDYLTTKKVGLNKEEWAVRAFVGGVAEVLMGRKRAECRKKCIKVEQRRGAQR